MEKAVIHAKKPIQILNIYVFALHRNMIQVLTVITFAMPIQMLQLNLFVNNVMDNAIVFNIKLKL